MHKCIGYFTGDEQGAPAHDPGLDVECVVCWKKLERPVKTISLIADGDNRSLFFRTHKACWESLSEDEKSDIESSILGGP